MRPNGIIYDWRRGRSRGEIRIVLSPSTWLFYRFLSLIGTGMIAASLASIAFFLAPIAKEEITYRLFSTAIERSELGRLVDKAKAEREYRAFVEEKAIELQAPNTSFSLVVPKINARAKVVANVSAGDSKAYMEALKEGVAHAAGTVFPGISGTTFLFAHSADAPLDITRYNAVFYLLRELEPGDNIYVFFGDRFYSYTVFDKKIVEAGDVSSLADAQRTPEQLILQTCWPPGTTLKRLLVVAKPVSV